MEVGDPRLGNLPMKGKQVNPGVNLRWGIISTGFEFDNAYMIDGVTI